jgi:prephenate dehydrogenase
MSGPISDPINDPINRGEPRRVIVVGAGLIGTSIALAMRERGAEVFLSDRDASALRMAEELGAGALLPDGGTADDGPPGGEPVDLAVLAVPPHAVAAALRDAQRRELAHAYTDVASVKAHVLAQAGALGCDLGRFVGGHPLAGRERSGPAAARADLFLGRPWALCPTPECRPEAIAAVTALARACGAEPLTVDVGEHDRAVALISHAPHVVSAAMAAQLVDAREVALGLSGQGVRDVTRVAGGDPALWLGILAANATPVADVLDAVATDLATTAAVLRVIAAGGAEDAGGALTGGRVAAGQDAADTGLVDADTEAASTADASTADADTEAASTADASTADASTADASALAAEDLVARLLRRGVTGRGRIPGKHGGASRSYAIVAVVINDRPGELFRLFAAAGEAGINIEDVAIEHSPGLPVGVAELSVKPEEAGGLAKELRARGWSVPR